jgi:hypothetical protein
MAVPVARNRKLAAALVEKIQSLWNPTAPDSVARTYTPDVYSEDDRDRLKGRQVRVSVLGESQVAKVDRQTTTREYQFLVLIVERLPSNQAGPPTDSWVDERNDFVADLSERLGDENEPFLLGSAYPERVDWTLPADDMLLRGQRLFWSAFQIAYRETM